MIIESQHDLSILILTWTNITNYSHLQITEMNLLKTEKSIKDWNVVSFKYLILE